MSEERIIWVTLKSEPERPDIIIQETVFDEPIIRTMKQNEIGDEEDEE